MSSYTWLKDDLAKSKRRTKRWIALGIIGLILVGCIGLALINNTTTSAKHDQFVKDSKQAKDFYNQLVDLNNQISSLPSATTKTQAEWDTYYSDRSSDLQSIQVSFEETSFNEPSKDGFTRDFKKALSDYSGLLTLDKSTSDLRFQIQSDNNTVTSDTNLVNEQEATARIGCFSSCDYSYVNAAKTQLATDTNTLNKDQQYLSEATSQLGAVSKTVTADINKADSDLVNIEYSGN